MKKWSQIDNNKKVETVKDIQIADILEEHLIVETNVDLSDDHVKIVGKDTAIKQIDEFYQKKFLKEKLHFLSEVSNNMRTGHFDYIDNLIEKLEKELDG